MAKNILVLIGGSDKRLLPFVEAGARLGADVVSASFSDVSYTTGEGEPSVRVRGRDVRTFDVIYFRLASKRQEEVSLIVHHTRGHSVKIVDSNYTNGEHISLPIKKATEALVLASAGVEIPKTYFGSLREIKKNGAREIGFPLVLKGTYGKRSRAVWIAKDQVELETLVGELVGLEKSGKAFIAQEFVRTLQRDRVLVVGSRAVGGITRPVKWRDLISKDAKRESGEIKELSQEEADLAVRASKVLGIEVAGVDVVKDAETGKMYILEVNSAPRWDSFQKDTGINVEEEIVRYLMRL